MKMLALFLALTLAAPMAFTGCDRTVESDTKAKTDSNGNTKVEKKTVTQTPNGDTTKVEEHKSTETH